MPFTRFMDMHSGGGQKEAYPYIIIEAPEQEAISIFYAKFGHNPERVTCTCCGDDYSIDEYEDLYQATAYERGCDTAYFDKDGNELPDHHWGGKRDQEEGITWRYVERGGGEYQWRPYQTLSEYLRGDECLVIFEWDIKPEWRGVTVPKQGYVWQD